MSRPATIEDLLDLKRGHKSDGFLVHRGCGGRVSYSFFLDRFACTHCGKFNVQWAWVHDRSIAKGKSGLYQWEPPVDYETGNAR